MATDFNLTHPVLIDGMSNHVLGREVLRRLEEAFDGSVAPLLDQNDPEDVNLSWEFRKFLHSKRLKVLTAERESIKKWKHVLLSR